MKVAAGLLLPLALLIAGCAGEGVPTPFQSELTPASHASHEGETEPEAEPGSGFCRETEDSEFESVPPFVRAQGRDTRGHFAFGGGCLHVPLSRAAAYLRTRAAMSWNDSDVLEWHVRKHSPWEPAYAVRHGAGPFHMAKWWMEWHHTAVPAEDSEEPAQLVVEYQKVSGTAHIRWWKGTISLARLSNDVTEFTMKNVIDAARQNAETAARTITDYYERLRAVTD